MPRTNLPDVNVVVIDREKARTLQQLGAQVLDVLSRDEYERTHLPGAVNIPLAELDQSTADQLRRDQPVIVYCYDYQ